MQSRCFTDQTHRYTRISKAAAKARFLAGKPVYFCPVKLRPGGPYFFGAEIDPKAYLEAEKGCPFDNAVVDYQHYNCGLNEVGYYAAYYIRETLLFPQKVNQC